MGSTKIEGIELSRGHLGARVYYPQKSFDSRTDIWAEGIVTDFDQGMVKIRAYKDNIQQVYDRFEAHDLRWKRARENPMKESTKCKISRTN